MTMFTSMVQLHDQQALRLWVSGRLLVIVAAVFIVLAGDVHYVDASCNDEQISSCRTAVVDGLLDTTSGGGECSRKQYADFTHLCLVNHYLPNIGHCCCQLERKVFCCRYHKTWNNFLCMESDDVIPVSSESADFKELMCTKVLPATLVPAICLVIVCIGCITFRRILRRKALVQKGSICCCTGSLVTSASDVRSRYPESTTRVDNRSTVPLAYSCHENPHRHSCSAWPANDIHINTQLVPTAPPFDVSHSESAAISCSQNYEVGGHPPNAYARLPSEMSSSLASTASCHHCQCCPMVARVSNSTPAVHCATVGWNTPTPPCSNQPPSYDESQFHRRLEPNQVVREGLQFSSELPNNVSSDVSAVMLQNSSTTAAPVLDAVADGNPLSTAEPIPEIDHCQSIIEQSSQTSPEVNV